MSVESAIEGLLFGRARTLSLPGAPPLAWPNDKFDRPSPDLAYIRVDHLPNRNTRLVLKGSSAHLRQGILQLTVVAPLLAGPDDATALAGAIAEHFPADLPLYDGAVKVTIQKAPDVIAPDKTDSSWDVRVDVYYDCLA